MNKIVTIISSRMDSNKTINTAASTWGQLKGELSSQGIDVSGMRAMVQQTKVNLENDNAVLPENNFTLFLTPGKIKSGN